MLSPKIIITIRKTYNIIFEYITISEISNDDDDNADDDGDGDGDGDDEDE